jgi:MOSC domain-containing protein YiiM
MRTVEMGPTGKETIAVAKLIALNVGLPRDVSWHDRTVYTGVWKKPVWGPRMVRRLNIDGDGQGDLGGHGGEQRAVLCTSWTRTAIGQGNCSATTCNTANSAKTSP